MAYHIPNGRAIAVQQKNRSIIENSLTSSWVWWNMHQASGATLIERAGKTGYTELTINGTATNVWTSRPGWFTCEPTTGNYMTVPESYANDLMALNTLTAGGVLTVCRIRVAVHPASSTQYVWFYGASNAYMYLFFSIGANFNVNCGMRNVGGSDANTIGSTNISSLVGTDMVIATYFDVSNNLYRMLVNDTTDKTKAMPTDGTAKPGTTITSSFGLGLCGRGDGSTRLTTCQASMKDMFIIRFTEDRSADIPAIVQGFMDFPNVLPWDLEGL